MDFSIVLAQSFLDSSEEFPVSFDDAWQWIGYSTKQKALNTLESYFEENLDYIFKVSEPSSHDKINQTVKKRLAGRSSHLYFLTANCFKEFGMVARTAKGKEVRKYFLECEKIAKQAIAQTPQPAPEPEILLPAEQQLAYMRSRAWEKSELMGLPVPTEKVKQRTGYRRAIDIARSLATQANQTL